MSRFINKTVLFITILIVGNVSVVHADNLLFQTFFFDACTNPAGTLAVRCAETPGGTGDLSGNSESSLNPNQSLTSNDRALATARQKTRNASKRTEALREQSTPSPFSLIVNARNADFDQARNDSDAERGLEGNVVGTEIGLDYRVSSQAVVGGLLTYERTDSEIDQDEAGVNFTPQGDSGGLESTSYSLILYGSYNVTDQLFFEGSVGYGMTDYTFQRNVVFQESTRTIAQTNVRTKSDTEGNQTWGSVGVGYDINRNAISVGPYARISMAKSSIDGYSENDTAGSGLEMDIDNIDRNSLTVDLGVRASYVISNSWGVLIPQFRVEYEHEFDQDAQEVTASYALDANNNQFSLEGDDPDRDYFNVGVGVSAIFPNGWLGFIEYESLVGHDDLDRSRFSGGVRVEF